MAATYRSELQQMKKVIEELNKQPNARLFYSMQERSVLDEVGGSKCGPKLTLKTISDKINNTQYLSINAFVDDMSLIFNQCSADAGLAEGATTVRVLFNELLAKYTSYNSMTPPGRKKRSRKEGFAPVDAPFSLQPDLEEFDDHLGDFGDIFDSLDVDDLQSEHRAALLELTEQLSLIEAEIQHLKDDSLPIFEDDLSTANSLVSYPCTSPYLTLGSGFYSSSQEEGRMTMSGQSTKKRSRRTAGNSRSPNSSSPTKKVRTKSKVDPANCPYYMSKEDLLHTITHKLPARFLEGVIKIVHPTFDPATATDEDLEFDINLLDEDVLLRLMKYVHGALEGQRQEAAAAVVRRTNTKDQRPRNATKKAAPKERLKKEAPKKRRTSVTQRRSALRKGRNSVSSFVSLSPQKRAAGFVASDRLSEIFQSEEVIHVSKCLDSEDEDVDILGL